MTHRLVVVLCTGDLVLVNGEASYVCPTRGSDRSHGSTDTAAAVQALHAWGEVEGGCNAGLVGSL